MNQLQANRPSKKVVEAFEKYNTPNISDALDKLGLKSGIHGITPQTVGKKIVGTAITMRMTAEGETKPTSHGGANPLKVAEAGDVIVVDNGGRAGENCWGEILAYAAKQIGVVGTIADGDVRDVDIMKEIGYPVSARGVTPSTARGRTMEESFNTIVRLGHVQVRPGDIVVADDNGVVVIPTEKAEEVLKITEEVFLKEQDIIEQVKKGIPFEKVDRDSGYDKMLQK